LFFVFCCSLDLFRSLDSIPLYFLDEVKHKVPSSASLILITRSQSVCSLSDFDESTRLSMSSPEDSSANSANLLPLHFSLAVAWCCLYCSPFVEASEARALPPAKTPTSQSIGLKGLTFSTRLHMRSALTISSSDDLPA